MKAFVLAGGLGTRLRPRFGDLPKALAPLQGRPFLARQLSWLRDRGITQSVILAGYGADQLRETLGDGESLGVKLEWSVESEPLGTGGALKLAERFVDGPVLVVNGDTLGDADPWKLERDRWERGATGAVALYRVEDAAARGRVEHEGDRILRFVEKDPDFRGPAWVNGGQYAFSPELWRHLPEGASSLERDVLPVLAEKGTLAGIENEGKFWDIGTPEDFERAERELRA
ncbi:MAG: NTP transferase domain-containing protein [Candidatus Eisenbacteria bacterium]|uniref:NTP transferase domain-containing protein n=1 Tax=Eiseniibacteriota bacterium TaxID=2212470 RepID=A0A933SA73_UNCEI|nr:NTP transferase domain-containing protein [Candidatus Eisenbacteria bacterium]